MLEGVTRNEAAARLRAERAIAEVRAGRPVELAIGGARALVLGADAFDAEQARYFAGFKHADGARLALSAPRLGKLGLDRGEAGTIDVSCLDPARIARLASAREAKVDGAVRDADRLDREALDLVRLALALPSALVVELDADERPADALPLREGDLEAYRRAGIVGLRIVGRAPVPLEGAPKTEFVVFRGGEGLRDQVAIIVGEPDMSKAVTVRLHSACLTGDLFGSLKCDCGDQLRGAVKRMADGEGGVLLYLDQEGRGSGIGNKMHAYFLQSQGLDTYDADATLGFEPDQRQFDFAAEMLRQLGVTAIRILTNNPQKIAAMRDAGLVVEDELRMFGRPTPQNMRYLEAKRDKAGHKIEDRALRTLGAAE
ncbi:MAG: GTP cyclohydrolase II RibA [Hyphomicrobiales bacterium]|nr:GTP cyclohydrolase II RibA [Hyphomicrobiales bacterium]